jgi:hypothetical protein
MMPGTINSRIEIDVGSPAQQMRNLLENPHNRKGVAVLQMVAAPTK